MELSTLLMRMRRRSPCEVRRPSTRPYDPPVVRPARQGRSTKAASWVAERRNGPLTGEVSGTDVEGEAFAPGASVCSVVVLSEQVVWRVFLHLGQRRSQTKASTKDRPE